MELINLNCNKPSEETFFINKTSEVNKNENTNKPDTRELDLNNVFINIFKNKNSKTKDGKSSTFNKFFDKILTENNNEYYFLIKVGKIHIPERIQKISAIVFPILLLSLLVYYFTKFYLKSLEGCPESNTISWCLGNFGQWKVRELIEYLNYSSLSFCITILLNRKYFKSIFLSFLLLTITFYLFYIDNGIDLYHHGLYNRIFFIIISLVLTLFIEIIYYTVKTLYLDLKRTLRNIIWVLFAIFLLYKYITYGSCKNWIYGFKGTMIDNSNSTCFTPIPDVCSLTIFDGLMDIPRYTGANCRDHSQYTYDKFTILPFSNLKNSITNYFAFPRTEKWDTVNLTGYGKFQGNVLNNLVDLEDDLVFEEVKNNVEFTLDFRGTLSNDKKFNATLSLKKNATLEKEMQERKILNDQKLKPIFNNVLVIFTDSLSRNHFVRKMPKTFKYLESKYNTTSEANENSTDIASYQFFKFQSLYPGTLSNMAVMYYGNYVQYNYTGITQKYKEAGFVVGTTMNYCGREAFDVEANHIINNLPNDHELNGIFCDPNHHSPEGPYSIIQGPYSMTKKCLWGKQTYQWSIDYAKQFFTAYRNNSKFFSLMNVDSHEPSAEVIKYDDDDLHEFLVWFEKEKFMEDTFVIIMADHGFFMPGWIYQFFNFQDYEIEMSLPSLFMLIPKKNPYFKFINHFARSNENNMITTFDLNQCLQKNIIPNDEVVGWGVCPLLGENDKNGCDYWSIDKTWCRCINLLKNN